MMNMLDQGRVSRRILVKRLLGGSAALVLAGVIATGGMPQSVSAGTGYFTTTAALNLRSQPSTSSAVILVIPAGGQVAQAGPEQDGFLKVTYSGSTGWAKSEYLSGSGGGGGAGADMPAYRGQAMTTSAVNMRTGAGMNYGVKLVVPAGASVEVYDDYSNYYWLVGYQGEYGYVHADYLKMSDEGDADTPTYTGMGVTTATVNLRSGGGTSYSVLQVVPEGAPVELYAGPASNWQLVRFGGQFGYIHADYVAYVSA